jgi:hypothetical protein
MSKKTSIKLFENKKVRSAYLYDFSMATNYKKKTF